MNSSGTAILTNVDDFIASIEAFKNMPAEFLDMTKKKLESNEWKAYRFQARVKDDEGWEADMIPNEGVKATYCWTKNDEYCFTNEEHYSKFVAKSYKTKGRCIFPKV